MLNNSFYLLFSFINKYCTPQFEPLFVSPFQSDAPLSIFTCKNASRSAVESSWVDWRNFLAEIELLFTQTGFFLFVLYVRLLRR